MSKVLKTGKDLPPATSGKCLKEGTIAPDISLDLVDGKKWNLYDSLKKQNIVLIFYRGGWCPFCNFQLNHYNKELSKIQNANTKVVAISVDKIDPDISISKNSDFKFSVASDPDLIALTAYNVVYKVPEDIVKKYKNSYKIDFEKSSGRKHHKIAVPAVVIIDKSKKITWCYANENYKIRPATKELAARVAALK